MVPAEGVAADLSHLNKKCKALSQPFSGAWGALGVSEPLVQVKGYAFDKDDKAIDKVPDF